MSSSELSGERKAQTCEWLPYSALVSAIALANTGKVQLGDGKSLS